MNLRLVPVWEDNPITLTCCACGKRCTQGNDNFTADLDGEPFQDYYCEECTQDINADIERQRAR